MEEYMTKLRGYYMAKLLKSGKVCDTEALGAYGDTVLRIACTCCDCAFLNNCSGAATCPIIEKELNNNA